MRKLLLIAGLAFAVSTSFGQKLEKLDDIKEKVQKGKYDEAKEKLDKVFENPQAASSSEALFYKAVVYHNLAKTKNDSTMSAAALDAMKKYMQLEQGKPDGQRALLSTLENNKTIVDLYQTNFNEGVENFKNNNFSKAYGHFTTALDVFDILSKQNLVSAKFDTTVTLYAGYSAQNARMYDKAATHYDVLINNNLSDTSYVPIYRFMINSNLENKDTTAARKYLDVSRERFPMYGDLWLDYQTLFISNDPVKRYDEYEALVKANPKNAALTMNFAIEMYNHIRSSDALENDTAFRRRTESALQNVLSLDPNSVTANLLMSQLMWTEYYQVQNRIDNIRGTFPEAVKKKKELNTKVDAIFERALPYLNKVADTYATQTTLKPQDKANYRIVLNQLTDYYTRKKQTAKVTELQAKVKSMQ